MKKILSIILASVALSSCVDTVILPDDKILDEDYWQKQGDVESVVAQAYNQLRDESVIRNMIVWADFRSDELQIASDFTTIAPYTNALSEIYSWNIKQTNAFTGWARFYSCINYCNLVLEKAAGVMELDPDYTIGSYQTTVAQVKALRAYCYFYLVRVFRDVPLVTEAFLNASDEMNIPQVAPATVLAQCIADLEEVESFAAQNNAYGNYKDRGYFNKDAIDALLADIYLWRASINHDTNDYQKCVDYCDKIIAAKKAAHVVDPNSPRPECREVKDYNLSSYEYFYGDIFGESGQTAEESIIELLYNIDGANNSALYQMYYNASGKGYGYLKTTKNYGVSNISSDASNRNVFRSPDDQRLYEFCFDAEDKNKTDYAVRKYVGKTGATSKTKDAFTSFWNANKNLSYKRNWILYRLTDIMLMKAEALVQLDRLDDAYDLAAVVNARAKEDNSAYIRPSTNKNTMEELILVERARELCFEGKRYFDLLRYNFRHMNGIQYDKLLSEQSSFPANSEEFLGWVLAKYGDATAMKSKVPDERFLYMPLNEDELKVNTALIQNSAYNK